MVSCTLKPMTVSMAVTNRASISTLKKVPRTANAPTTTTTSWSSATSAVTPNFTSWKRNVIQSRIPAEPTMIRMIAWVTSSELTTAPIVVRLRCSAIGPSSAWSAVATSPSLPLVGISVLPRGPAEADGDAPGDADAPADADADGLGEALGVTLALGAALALALGPALALAAALPDGAAEPALEVGASVATGVAAGSFSWRPTICWVLISMNPEPVVTALASRPCAANTALTWSGLTAGFSNRISHFVPPV